MQPTIEFRASLNQAGRPAGRTNGPKQWLGGYAVERPVSFSIHPVQTRVRK